MKLSKALRAVDRIALDTAPIIYFVERKDRYYTLMNHIIQKIDSGEMTGFSSVITLTEVLIQPFRLEKLSLVLEYRNLFMNSRNFELIPIDIPTAEMAARLRAKYNLPTPDALQVSSAINSGCQAFITNDLALKRVDQINVLVLEELTLD